MEKTMDRRTANQWAFLGAALMDPEAARPYMSRMVAAMFAPGGCREVFAAVQRLSLGGQAVDVITVANAAQAATGRDCKALLVQMADTCPSVTNIGSYAAQILEDYRYELLQADLMKCMAKDAMDADSVCRQLRRTLAMQDAISTTQADTTAREFDAVLETALAQLDEPDTSLKLGWPELDRYGVFHRGRTCVVAGRPGCGKTDFSINLASRLSKKYRVYYLTLEETAEALMDRILSKVSRIDSGKLTNKTLTPREREIIDNTAGILRRHHNMMLDADSNLTIDGLEAKLIQHKPDIAFIDHIGLLSPTDPRQTEYQSIREITRRLKVAAMKMGIVVVELCQINRAGVKGNEGRFCNLEDLRGSGTIEQDANSAIFVENRKPEDSKELRGEDAYQDTAVMYAKNREGPTGVVSMRWQPQYHQWQPVPKEDFEEIDQMNWPQ
ncbi:DnaB-like helicase C-terminal domain-containing protein [uncultured Gemmiger sp.]|uniref:replicative DNA helicase n=1 Tax=uncultured Gemmiger sp. TaxID=1623490 RepID=UPI0028054813|nr:DnaB-like helicase C-terminal domain-containing protein [uncultured Gemmiger sp.]